MEPLATTTHSAIADGRHGEHAPDEFRRFADDPASLTSVAARRYGVSPVTFTNWRWHMRHQITDAAAAEQSHRLSPEEQDGFRLLDAAFIAGVTPYYMALMDADPAKSCPI